jgi:hypothetical protein
MGRAEELAAHLPPLYRDGAVVGGLTALWGLQLAMLDEASLSLQRSHWFDSTPDLDDAAALGALLGIVPEEFHADLGEYRAWVHAVVDARLAAGAVTREAIRILVDTYVQGFQRAAGIDLVPPVASWAPTPDRGPALVESPARLRFARLPATGGWEPLARLEVVNAGIDPAPWALVLTGTAGGSEFAPFVANRTTGHALVYRGEVAVGARLTIAPTAADPGRLRADLDGTDVTDRLDSYPSLVAGPAGPGAPSDDDGGSALALGRNELWFLPLAHYDTPGLGRFLLALADDALQTGRFDQTHYDHALFAQPPAVSADLVWVEREPASLEVHLPGQALRSANGADAAIAARDRLERGLDAAVDRTASVGVATDVVLTRYRERQPGVDRLALVLPRAHREVGPTGADRLAEAGGLFDVTGFDDSVLR